MRIMDVISLLAVAGFGGSCTHEYRVPILRPQLSDQVVVTNDGHRIDVTPIDSEHWQASTGQRIGPDQVEQSESRSRGRGAAQGALAGGILGSVAGLIVGSIIASHSCHSSSSSSGSGLDGLGNAIGSGVSDGLCEGLSTVGGFAIGIVGGVVIGSVIGGVRGARSVYRRAAPRVQAVPTAGPARAQLTWRPIGYADSQ